MSAELDLLNGASALAREGMVFRTHESIRAIGRARWNSMSKLPLPPHLSFEWLDALESSGVVAPERGWLPLHLTLEEGGRILAAAPCYVRGDSSGEFVFDQSWAAYAEQHLNIRYYPKLVLAVPFTPATGPRVLVASGAHVATAFAALAQGVDALMQHLGSSGAHALFSSPEQAKHFVAQGWQERHGLQFHWTNRGYTSFDEFLRDFSSKRRNQIRRERRKLANCGLKVEALSGCELSPALAQEAFALYSSTVDKFSWGRRYLNQRFFETIFETMPEQLLMIVATEANGRIVALALNLIGEDTLYGRYWGTRVDVPFLHFECCYYRGVEEAIARGLSRFEPGAGGEHKLSRGFRPTVTYSFHRLRDPRLSLAVDDFLTRERRVLGTHREEALTHCGLRDGGSLG